MNVCGPIGCPEGYHNMFDWEDNVCYSNEMSVQMIGFWLKMHMGRHVEPEQLIQTFLNQ